MCHGIRRFGALVTHPDSGRDLHQSFHIQTSHYLVPLVHVKSTASYIYDLPALAMILVSCPANHTFTGVEL